MRIDSAVRVLVLLLFAVPAQLLAQQQDDQSVLPTIAIPGAERAIETAPALSDAAFAARAEELKQWMEAFTEWQQWAAKWMNRRQPGVFSGARERREKPAPPAWLAEQCASLFEGDDRMAACTMLAEWREDAATAGTRRARAIVRQKDEDEAHASFLSKVHVDLLWPTVQWQESIYGVLGTHVATKVGKRFQVFLAPGFMLLNVPSPSGVRRWTVATNYGFGYHLGDFTLPGNRPASLHLNIAKAYVLTEPSESLGGRTVDLVGFSLTFPDRR